MNKKKILADLVGYLVRKEITVREVLDAYYEESERHFFEDEFPEVPEVTIPSEEQKEPDYKLEPLPCKFEGQRELTQDEINQAVTDVNRIFENKALQINAEKRQAETLETLETEAETIETPAATKETKQVTEVIPAKTKETINGDYKLKDIHKLYKGGPFYESVKDFILDGKTIDEHLKEHEIPPIRFYDRLNSKGWTIRKAATTPINYKFDYSQIMPNGKTVLQNLQDNGLAKSTFMYRLRRGNSVYESCATSEYDMRSKWCKKAAQDKREREKLKQQTKIVEGWSSSEPEPVKPEKMEVKPEKSPEKMELDKRKYVLDDDKPAKNVVVSNIPDLTLVDLCQNMKISMARLKDRIDKGTFPKPDRGNKWSYGLVHFYFPK